MKSTKDIKVCMPLIKVNKSRGNKHGGSFRDKVCRIDV